MIKISQILGVRSKNSLQIRTFTIRTVIFRQEFVNNFAILTEAPIILPLRHGRKQMHRHVTVDSILHQ